MTQAAKTNWLTCTERVLSFDRERPKFGTQGFMIYDFVVVVVWIENKLQKSARDQQLVNSLSQRPNAHFI